MSGDMIEMTGVVLRCHRGDVCEVEATIGSLRRVVLARRSGRLNQRHIRIIPGDIVTVEVSPYDLGRGRIVYRGVRGERTP